MILDEPVVFVTAGQAPLVAEALRHFARNNGGLPPWAAVLVEELTSLSTSAKRQSEVSLSVSRCNLSNVTCVGTRIASKRLNISDRGVRDLCERGSLVGAEIVGSHWVIPAASIDAYLKHRTRKGTRRAHR